MKSPLMLLALFASGLLCAADGYEPGAGPSGVQISTPAASPEAKALVEAMSEYELQNNIVNSLEVSRNWFKNRVRYEMHLGGGLLWLPTADSLQSGVPGWRLSSAADLRPAYTMGVKVNLGNLKMVQPERTLASLERLKHLLALRRFAFTDSAMAEVAQMQAQIEAYQSEFWWKRLSLGLQVPFLYRTERGVQAYVYNNNNYANPYYETMPGFGFDHAAFTLGYDLGDVATLSLGYSSSNAFYTGLSMDVSTPVYIFAETFYSLLRSWAGTDNRNYYNGPSPAFVR